MTMDPPMLIINDDEVDSVVRDYKKLAEFDNMIVDEKTSKRYVVDEHEPKQERERTRSSPKY